MESVHPNAIPSSSAPPRRPEKKNTLIAVQDDATLMLDKKARCSYDVIGPLFEAAGILNYRLPATSVPPHYDRGLWARALSTCVVVEPTNMRVLGFIREVKFADRTNDLLVEVIVTAKCSNEILYYFEGLKDKERDSKKATPPLPSLAVCQSKNATPVHVTLGNSARDAPAFRYLRFKGSHDLDDDDAAALRKTIKALPGFFARMPIFRYAYKKNTKELCVTACLGYALNVRVKERDTGTSTAQSTALLVKKEWCLQFELLTVAFSTLSFVTKKIVQRVEDKDNDNLLTDMELTILLILVPDKENQYAPPWAHNLDAPRVDRTASTENGTSVNRPAQPMEEGDQSELDTPTERAEKERLKLKEKTAAEATALAKVDELASVVAGMAVDSTDVVSA